MLVIFLRIQIPWDSSPFFTTIWDKNFGTFSQHRTSKSKRGFLSIENCQSLVIYTYVGFIDEDQYDYLLGIVGMF